MPKKSQIPLEMVSVRLYEGDKDILQSFYPTLGYNVVLREIVHRHTKALLEREARSENLNGPVAIDDGELLTTGDVTTG